MENSRKIGVVSIGLIGVDLWLLVNPVVRLPMRCGVARRDILDLIESRTIGIITVYEPDLTEREPDSGPEGHARDRSDGVLGVRSPSPGRHDHLHTGD